MVKVLLSGYATVEKIALLLALLFLALSYAQFWSSFKRGRLEKQQRPAGS